MNVWVKEEETTVQQMQFVRTQLLVSNVLVKMASAEMASLAQVRLFSYFLSFTIFFIQ